MRPTLAERTLNRRKELNLTQDDVAKATGTTRVSISNIELGISLNVRASTLFALAEALNCDAEWLLNGVEPKPTVVPLQNNSDQNEIALEPVAKYVPLINWEQACSWTPTNIDIESASKLPCPVKCSDRTFALEVQGESMEPRFEAGDFIFVDPEQLEPSPGQFIIVQLAVNTPAILKEFQMLDGYKILKALNPNYPADMRYVKVNDTCRLLGTLVSHVKPV
ncbi:phage repressor protein [Photobacterium kishitanii]|uniref:helix-turn-helix domain-containing protein n=1 Tax=Photobacterium kishitanii TaxID=318456 RepID=UPI000D155C41|nr:S24 family peptidase [Photobacterium kishitanii]PSV11684.1 phage repressor protein [Photobacterium kishitanii]